VTDVVNNASGEFIPAFCQGEETFEMNTGLKLVRKPAWKHTLKPVIALQTVLSVSSCTYLFAVCDRSPPSLGIVATPGWLTDICKGVLGQSSLGQIFL